MYLALSLNVATDPRVYPSPKLLAKCLSMTWTRFLLSLHVLFQTHTLLLGPLSCSAASIISSGNFTVVSQNKTSVVPTNGTTAASTGPTQSILTTQFVNATSVSSVAALLPTQVSSVQSQNATLTSTLTTTSPSQPTQSIDPTTLEEIHTLQSRRLSSIIGATSSPDQISAW